MKFYRVQREGLTNTDLNEIRKMSEGIFKPEISFVIPVYNEETTLPELIRRVRFVFESINDSCELVLVDDGSTDESQRIIREAVADDSRIRGVILSRNHGHQLAVTAGMSQAKCSKAAFILDGDLQDPPELVSEFLVKLDSGFDVVYGIRKKRKEGIVLRSAYFLAYRLIRWFSDIEIPLDAGDFAMISKRVLDRMVAMPERNRYLRGIRAWVGYPQCGLEYEREERYSGESKYSFKMLLNLMYQGVFSFSEVPIRMLRCTGIISLIICLTYSAYLLTKYFVFGAVPEGFTTLILFVFFLFAVQIFAIGVVGEYVARTLKEARARPQFIIQELV